MRLLSRVQKLARQTDESNFILSMKAQKIFNLNRKPQAIRTFSEIRYKDKDGLLNIRVSTLSSNDNIQKLEISGASKRYPQTTTKMFT